MKRFGAEPRANIKEQKGKAESVMPEKKYVQFTCNAHIFVLC
jgi:hypothetical protein